MEEIMIKVFDYLYLYAPRILGAFLVFIFGFYLAKWIGKKFTQFLKRTRVGLILQKEGIEKIFRTLSSNLDAPIFFGELLRWCLFLLVLIACFEILNWTYLSNLLIKVLGYVPNIFVASVIFVFSAFIIDLSSKVIIGSIKDKEVVYSPLLGKTFSLVIWSLAFLGILYQLKIVPELVLIIFAGLVGVVVLVFGISFGLAGKDLAQKILKELEKKIK
jgi:hypothetical protein